MLLKDFDYDLPEELIAQYPLTGGTTRACWSWKSDKPLHHAVFTDLPAWLNPNDLLVFNDTR